jgi:predicted Rossmann fold nucleotide-binding protein DprA/Smf involved in DNA uptake
MVVPLVYGLFAGASAATPIVARALNSPAANKLINEGAKLVGRYPKNLANRVAAFLNPRITSTTQTLAQDARSGFVGTTTEGPEVVPLVKGIGELGSVLGPYMLSQVKPEDFPTGLKNMKDVEAVVETASNFDGVTPEQLQRLIEDYLIPENTEEN